MIALLLSVLAHAGDVDVRVGVGLPDVVEVYAGGSPSPSWELHGALGTNFGLLTYFGAGVGGVWRPGVWGGSGAHRFSVGIGPDVWAGPAPSVVAVIGAATLDLRYAWHPSGAAAGLVLASRWGVGATTDLGASGADRGRVELALLLQPVQVGVTF